jgi:hypothetical protein
VAQTKTAAASRKKTTKAPVATKAAASKAKGSPRSQGPAAGKSSVAKAKKPLATASQPKKASRAVELDEVTIDRRRQGRRNEKPAVAATPAAEAPVAAGPKLERREKVSRRRQIDPTTCERDYSESEVEFMNALDEYKRKNGRMFPTCSEVLEVVRGLGYVQLTRAELAARGPAADDSMIEDAAEREAREALALSAQFREEPTGLPLVTASADND